MGFENPTTSATSGVATSAVDNTFEIQDDGDELKKMRFETSGITSGQTRILTIQDLDGTLALTSNKLSDFAATTSAELAGVISDETGSGLLVFGTSPTLTTPLITTNGSIDVTGVGTLLIGASMGAFDLALGSATGSVTTKNDLIVTNNLTVNGTTTTINTATLDVEDINITLGNVTTPSDITADGGGITLLGDTNKTITWDNANDNWTSNQDWNIATGLDYKVNNVSVLNATTLGGAVLASSLTSLGTIASLVAGTADINAGTVDAVIGGTTPAAGTFTTITVDNTTFNTNSLVTTTTNNLSLTATDAAMNITVGTGAGDDFTINSTGFVYEGDTGNVGIGTATPSVNPPTGTYVPGTILSIESEVTGDPGIFLRRASTDNGLYLWHDSSTGDSFVDYISASLNFRTGSLSVPENVMTLAPDGNVGIGGSDANSPNTKLHLSSQAQGSGIQRLLRLQNESVTAGDGVGIVFTTSTSANNDDWFIDVLRESTDADRTFIIGSSGNSRTLVLNKAGNVGIGINPVGKLDILAGGVGNTKGLYLVNNAGNDDDSIEITFAQSSATHDMASIRGVFKTISEGSEVADLVFYTSTAGTNTQKMLISGAGNVGIGNTPSGTFKLEVESSGIAAKLYTKSATADTDVFNINSDVGGIDTNVWRVEADGDTISNTNSYTSDINAKKDIKELELDSLNIILGLEPKQFKFKTGKDIIHYGFIAQEVEKIIPNLIKDNGLDDGNGGYYKSMNYNGLFSILVKAMQELNEKVEMLEAKLNEK